MLPTFDLDNTANIVAWNKLRLFIQTYELRSSRRLQVSVVYLLIAWVCTCVYQAVKAYLRRGDEVIDIETIFVMISTTVVLAFGLSAILLTGKWINDITQIGLPHVLRIKQAELLEKSTHYLVEHDFWNGSFLHKVEHATDRRKCIHHEHEYAHVGRYATESSLQHMKISQLRKQAELLGMEEEAICDAVDDKSDPKGCLVALVSSVTKHQLQSDLALEFQERGGKRTHLEQRARAAGVPEASISAAGDVEDPAEVKTAIIKLIVEAFANGHTIYDRTDQGLLEAINMNAEEDERDKGAPGLDASVIDDDQGPPRDLKQPTKPMVTTIRRDEPDAAHTWAEARSLQTSDKRSAEMTTHCYRLLETLIQTVYDEYRVGSRAHWGAEDRRTKLWFIVMGQNTIKGFAAALLSGLSPVVIHAIDKSGIFEP